ncbi:GTPase ObgE [Candidatus Gracilibacteria bacterium]|nr:GTPase ObgE [Candidatus Gracilibacteria bacterium]
MQFYDELKIYIESGKGGDGSVSGRREAKIPYGGPSGGDGGDGGSIVFVASKDENTLLAFRYKKIFKAKPGEPGRNKDQFGANAENLTLKVPVGTVIRDAESGNVLHHFIKDQEEREALKGGDGGKGNIHFKDAVNQYPTFCLLGEPGHKREIILELQLLADVAFIGTPSVGKSSLINAISHSKAKVAEYPFTTLIPNLGSVSVGDYTFNVIDIPGLIDGASQGKGLGNAFLRHVLKSKVFCFILDAARYDSGIDDLIQLWEEIDIYVRDKFILGEKDEILINEEGGYMHFIVKKDGEIIIHKKILILINKYDLINDMEIIQEYQSQVFKVFSAYLKKNKMGKVSEKMFNKNTFVISAATHLGLDEMLKKFVEILKSGSYVSYEEVLDRKNIHQSIENFAEEITDTDKELLLEKGYIQENEFRYGKVWKISDPEVCRLVYILQRGNEEAEMWFWKYMGEKGFLELLEDMGIKKGDVLKIKSYYEGYDDRYILY